MSRVHVRAMAMLLCFCLGGISLGLSVRPAYAVSPNLAWKPYLQQVGDTSAIILWTTKTGANPSVEYWATGGDSTTVSGSTRSLSALNTQLHRVALTGLQAGTTYNYKIYTAGEELLPGEALAFK